MLKQTDKKHREKINTYNEINMRAMNNINVLLYRN